MSKEEQKPNIYQIPKNSFDTGYVLNGQFKTRNFVEGIILALPFLGIFIYGWHDLGWDVQSTVAYCAILCAAAFLGAAHGVGGDSLFEFIQRVIRFRQSRRISKYNPRIKTELEPEYLIHDGRMLPKDKLKQMLTITYGVGLFAQFPAVVIIGILAHDGRIAILIIAFNQVPVVVKNLSVQIVCSPLR